MNTYERALSAEKFMSDSLIRDYKEQIKLEQ